MSEPNESPGTRAPADANPPAPAPAAPDMSRQIAELTDAVNQLLAAQRQQQAPAPAPAPDRSAAVTDARDRYVREHLADLPEAYRRQMPEASDERQLAEAEQAIRRQFRGDLRAALGAGAAADAGADVGGEIQGGRGPAAAAAAVEHGRLSGVQQIALGLRDAKPIGPAHPEVVHAPARHDATPATGQVIDTVPSGAD